MKKNLTYSLVAIITVLFTLQSCTKTPSAIEKLKKSCLYSNKIDYFKKWANTYTEIDLLTPSGAVQSKSFIYPLGYFQLSSDGTYAVLSDNVPQNGNWTINDSCQLVLDPLSNIERRFDVLLLSNDSLTIRRTTPTTRYIQHYTPYRCPSVSQLEKQWDNTYTSEQNYTSTTLGFTTFIYPTGFFTLNSDMTYNVFSDGVPQNGPWELDPTTCKLVLDKNSPAQRAFDIQKITTDTLIIWRKDTVAKINYQQHYLKH